MYRQSDRRYFSATYRENAQVSDRVERYKRHIVVLEFAEFDSAHFCKEISHPIVVELPKPVGSFDLDQQNGHCCFSNIQKFGSDF